ncbi:MAG: hypothetical protein ACPG7F_16875 [Aggregatilineales bacterium]
MASKERLELEQMIIMTEQAVGFSASNLDWVDRNEEISAYFKAWLDLSKYYMEKSPLKYQEDIDLTAINYDVLASYLRVTRVLYQILLRPELKDYTDVADGWKVFFQNMHDLAASWLDGLEYSMNLIVMTASRLSEKQATLPVKDETSIN